MRQRLPLILSIAAVPLAAAALGLALHLGLRRVNDVEAAAR